MFYALAFIASSSSLFSVFLHQARTDLRVLDDGGLETLGVLDVDGLNVGVQLLLGALLVVTLARDADAQAVRDTLDTGLPHLLVELGVEADVLGALLYLLAQCLRHFCLSSFLTRARSALCDATESKIYPHTIAFSANARISLTALGALFLKLTP